MGVRVTYGGRAMQHSGLYIHEARVVVLRTGMSTRLERCVLTHEAVHAEYGDVPQWDGEHHDMIELRTDVVMAHRLIGHRQWRRYGHLSVPEVCDALHVVPRVVEVYRTYGAGLDARPQPQEVGAR